VQRFHVRQKILTITFFAGYSANSLLPREVDWIAGNTVLAEGFWGNQKSFRAVLAPSALREGDSCFIVSTTLPQQGFLLKRAK
jgi:hypothetical protein